MVRITKTIHQNSDSESAEASYCSHCSSFNCIDDKCLEVNHCVVCRETGAKLWCRPSLLGIRYCLDCAMKKEGLRVPVDDQGFVWSLDTNNNFQKCLLLGSMIPAVKGLGLGGVDGMHGPLDEPPVVIASWSKLPTRKHPL